jgi:large subunit ribosomal protein L23
MSAAEKKETAKAEGAAKKRAAKTAAKAEGRRAKARKSAEAGAVVNTSKYNSERLMTVLLAPVISEKATFIADKHEQVVFRVAQDATKPEIKAAVEGIFKVKVTAVNTLRLEGKTKRFRGYVGKRPDVKKAIVTLAEGNQIDVTTGV